MPCNVVPDMHMRCINTLIVILAMGIYITYTVIVLKAHACRRVAKCALGDIFPLRDVTKGTWRSVRCKLAYKYVILVRAYNFGDETEGEEPAFLKLLLCTFIQPFEGYWISWPHENANFSTWQEGTPLCVELIYYLCF